MRLPIVIFVLFLVGCSDTEPLHRIRTYCSPDTANVRANFILECVKNANPKSDEEPEAWVAECRETANSLYCEKRQAIVVYSSSGMLKSIRWIGGDENETDGGNRQTDSQ